MGEIRSSFHESRRLTWAEADFPFADARAAKPWKDFGAGLVFGDKLSASVDYSRHFKESMTVADGVIGSADYARELSDGFALSDGFDWLTLSLLSLVDSFGLSDSKTERMDYAREYPERINLAVGQAQMMSAALEDRFSILDTVQMSAEFKALHREALRVAAAFSQQGTFLHEYVEDVRIAELFASKFATSYAESLRLKETFLRPADIVLADVSLQDTPYDLASFRALCDTAPGYEPFIPYNVGEYEYQKALVRLVVEAGAYGSEPVVYDAVINVDIEDTVDRGTVTIADTTKPTRVRFNKHYYTRPEVSVTLQGGNTAAGIVTPNIVAIDKDNAGFYFDVELIKSDKTRAQGRITWSAVGY